MANADVHADMVRVVDKKIADIFQNYLEKYQTEEITEEQNFQNQLNELNKKVDTILNLLQTGNFNTFNNKTDNIVETIEKPKRRRTKKDEVFIPTIEKTETKMKKSEDKTKIVDNNINETLNILNNLK